jgi:hypothetical protein
VGNDVKTSGWSKKVGGTRLDDAGVVEILKTSIKFSTSQHDIHNL